MMLHADFLFPGKPELFPMELQRDFPILTLLLAQPYQPHCVQSIVCAFLNSPLH